VIEVPVSFAGIPFLLIDTAGLRTGGGAIESVGIQRAEQQIAAADVVLWMGRPEVAPDHPRIIRLHGQVDRLDRHDIPPGSLAVSSITGAGLESLVEQLTILGRTLLPEADVVALNDRQAKALREVADAVSSASPKELELTAEAFRQARSAIDRVTGSAGVEDLLDSLFRRFCLGK
jgi:tRNA modification GTPase